MRRTLNWCQDHPPSLFFIARLVEGEARTNLRRLEDAEGREQADGNNMGAHQWIPPMKLEEKDLMEKVLQQLLAVDGSVDPIEKQSDRKWYQLLSGIAGCRDLWIRHSQC